MPGFEAKKIETIEIAVAKTTQLSVATQQGLVEITATAATLGTSSSSLVANVEDKSVQERPMNGRDFHPRGQTSARIDLRHIKQPEYFMFLLKRPIDGLSSTLTGCRKRSETVDATHPSFH